MIHEKIQIKNNYSDLTNTENSHLSTQISLDGLKYCIHDKDIEDVVFVKEYSFSIRPQTPEQLLQNIEVIYKNDSLLTKKYESVSVSHKNNLASIVPEALYEKEHQSDFLKYSVKVLENDLISVDELIDSDAKSVYIPFQNINLFLRDKYDSFDSMHTSSILISSLIKYHRHTPFKQFFINVSKSNLDIIYLDNNQLQLYNSFLYYTKEDFLYYILFAMEQLSLNPDKQVLTFIGDIDMISPLYDLTYTYVRNINFLDIENQNLSKNFYQRYPHIEKHHHFELFNQF